MPFIDLKTQYETLKIQIQARINSVLEHGQYIMGPEVRELEQRLEAYTNANHCITVASGTEALLIGLMALGVGSGDEVITTPFSFVATAEVIVLLGAKPVFVDIEPDTCNLNWRLIEAKITPTAEPKRKPRPRVIKKKTDLAKKKIWRDVRGRFMKAPTDED